MEISVRTALGASRARIAGQLFAEALVLSSIAAGVGLAIAGFALKWVKTSATAGMGRMMFWWDDSIAPETIVYAAVLAVLAALIIGVTPALKATGPRVQERLKQSTGATSAGVKFGGGWTGVIVTQVAVTVIFLAIVGMLGWTAYGTNGGGRDRNFPAAEYVAVRLGADRSNPDPGKTPEQLEADYRNQIRTTYAQIARQLAADASVEAITYGSRLPGMNFLDMRIEVDGLPGATQGPRRTSVVLQSALTISIHSRRRSSAGDSSRKGISPRAVTSRSSIRRSCARCSTAGTPSASTCGQPRKKGRNPARGSKSSASSAISPTRRTRNSGTR